MSVKVDVIKKSISQAKKRIKKIDDLLNANPLEEIILIRKKAFKIMEENKENHSKIAKLIKPLAAREQQLFQIAKKQTNSNDLIGQKAALIFEIGQLEGELFLEQKKLEKGCF